MLGNPKRKKFAGEKMSHSNMQKDIKRMHRRLLRNNKMGQEMPSY